MTFGYFGSTRLRAHARILVAAILATSLVGCAARATPSAQPTGSASALESQTLGPSASAPSSAPATPAPTGDIVDIPLAEGTLNDVLLGDGLVVAGGGFFGELPEPAIVYFENGGWTAAEVPGTHGQVMGLARLGGQWIAVGNELPDERNGFIWTSADGREWIEALSIPDAALYDVVATHDVAVAVGAHHDEEMNATAAAWSSSDGQSWAEGAVDGAEGSAMRSATVWSGGFAASGEGPNGQTQPIWTAVDPADWGSVTTNLEPPRIVVDIVDWDGGLAAVGASDKSGDQHPFVALSADGAAWTQTILSPDEEGYGSAMAVAGETLVSAGVDADRLTLWTLAADVWQPQTIEPEGATINSMAWTPDEGLVGVGSKGGNLALWRLGFD